MFKSWLNLNESIGDVDGFLDKFSDYHSGENLNADWHANVKDGDFRNLNPEDKSVILSDVPEGAKVVQGDIDGRDYHRVIELPNGQYMIQSKYHGSNTWINGKPQSSDYHTMWNLAARNHISPFKKKGNGLRSAM